MGAIPPNDYLWSILLDYQYIHCSSGQDLAYPGQTTYDKSYQVRSIVTVERSWWYVSPDPWELLHVKIFLNLIFPLLVMVILISLLTHLCKNYMVVWVRRQSWCCNWIFNPHYYHQVWVQHDKVAQQSQFNAGARLCNVESGLSDLTAIIGREDFEQGTTESATQRDACFHWQWEPSWFGFMLMYEGIKFNERS